MALRKFTPDLDLYDPDDDEGWIGTWEHDDGTSLYGQGDPDMGRELLAANDAEPLGPDGIEPNQPALDANAPRADFQSPYQSPDREAMTPAPARVQSPAVQQSSPAPMAGADAVAPRAGWEDDVPPQVASALREQAEAAGLNPDILAAIIKHESGWDPSSVNQDTRKHGGLIQFDRDVTWPGVAKTAGRPDVTWEQALGMSAEEQIPFVVAYYKDKGLSPEASAGDYYKRTFMPAFAGEKDDFVLGERGSNEQIGGLNKGKVWEQNQSLDLNKDGRITNAEVAQTGERKYAQGGAGGGAANGTLGAPAGSPMLPAGAPGIPSSFAGLPASQVQVQGVPLTPEQLRQQQQGVGSRYASAAQAHQQAQEARLEGRRETMNYVQQLAETEKDDALGAIAKKQQIHDEAAAKVQKIVGEPIQKIDPKRVISQMSTGQKVMGAIAVLMSAIGQAAGSMVGMNLGNSALQLLDHAIEDDIQSQKDAIDRGERSQSNRLAYWRQVLGDADSAVEARRAELKHAAGMMLQARAMGQDIADIEAQGIEHAANLFAQGQAEMDKLTERENQRLTIQYETPKAPATGPDKLLERIRALKETEQELRMSGMSDGEIDQFFRSSGLTRLGGETVPQATARQGVERQADEETSKELEPVSLAETGWRKALTALDAVSNHALISERYSEPGEMVGSDFLPGVPTVPEVRALQQSLGEAINAMVRAEKGSQTPEDLERIKAGIIGSGSIEDIRRGIQTQLEKLELQRQMVTARRSGAASRVETRQGAETMPRVSGKVYIPGAGPLR